MTIQTAVSVTALRREETQKHLNTSMNRTLIRLMLCVVFVTICAAQGRGAFSGADNFDDGQLSGQLWAKSASYQGNLVESNGRLNFTAPGFSSYDFPMASLTWLGGSSRYNEPFSAIVDATADPSDLNDSLAFLGMRIASTDGGKWFCIDLESQTSQQNYGNPPIAWKLASYTRDAVSGTGGEGPVSVSLRMSFDPATQQFMSYYDLDGPSNGYAWTLCNTASASGWSSGSEDTVQLSLYGRRGEGSVPLTTDSGIYLDNFSVVPEPISFGLLGVGCGAAALRIRRP